MTRLTLSQQNCKDKETIKNKLKTIFLTKPQNECTHIIENISVLHEQYDIYKYDNHDSRHFLSLFVNNKHDFEFYKTDDFYNSIITIHNSVLIESLLEILDCDVELEKRIRNHNTGLMEKKDKLIEDITILKMDYDKLKYEFEQLKQEKEELNLC